MIKLCEDASVAPSEQWRISQLSRASFTLPSDSHYLTWSWSNMFASLGSIKEKYAIICKFNWLKTKVNKGSWKISERLQLSSREGNFAQPMQVYRKSLIFDNYLYENCKVSSVRKDIETNYRSGPRSLDEFGACSIKALGGYTVQLKMTVSEE